MRSIRSVQCKRQYEYWIIDQKTNYNFIWKFSQLLYNWYSLYTKCTLSTSGRVTTLSKSPITKITARLSLHSLSQNKMLESLKQIQYASWRHKIVSDTEGRHRVECYRWTTRVSHSSSGTKRFFIGWCISRWPPLVWSKYSYYTGVTAKNNGQELYVPGISSVAMSHVVY